MLRIWGYWRHSISRGVGNTGALESKETQVHQPFTARKTEMEKADSSLVSILEKHEVDLLASGEWVGHVNARIMKT